MPTAVASHEGGASAPRTGLLPILAASRIRYSAKHDRPIDRSLFRLGVALGAATHAILARGGWPSRRGHLRALASRSARFRPNLAVWLGGAGTDSDRSDVAARATTALR